MIGIEDVVKTIVYVIVVAGIFAILFGIVAYCEMREPFNRFARIFLVVCAGLVLIGILLGLIGHPVIRW